MTRHRLEVQVPHSFKSMLAITYGEKIVVCSNSATLKHYNADIQPIFDNILLYTK